VDIIAGRATGAVLVPVEAVRDLGDGTYAVFVLENDQPVMRVVTIGITDLTYVEITSGLSAGETVTTGIVETK
jgi:multidrug efflux pump subunit AcrA (membrane-fusion protein)